MASPASSPNPPARPNLLGKLGPAAPFALLHNPVGFFQKLADAGGSVASIQLGRQRFVLLNEPETIKDFLVTQSQLFEKFPRIDKTKGLFGEGLLTSEEPLHMRQRRLAQPGFHRQKLFAYGETMLECCRTAVDQFPVSEPFDVAKRMNLLALDIVSRTLFSTRTDAHAESIGHQLDVILRMLNQLVMPWGSLLLSLPIGRARKYRKALAALDEIVFGIIDQRLAEMQERPDGAPDDLLSMLISARAEDDGAGMSRQQLRDEVMTLFVAGHDTSANGLAWALYCLAENPEWQERAAAQVAEVLQGKELSAQDYPRLGVLEQIVLEALRLYPPVWILGRKALQPYRFAGLDAEPGDVLLVCMAVLHRQEALFAEPAAFRPERWAEPKHHRYSFLPFGAGGRMCIGERFAMMEAVLALATIVTRFRFRLVPNQKIRPLGLLTLRPKFGVQLVMEPRG